MSDADHNIRNRERTSSGAANGSSSLRERKDKKGAGDANYAKGPSTMKRGSTSKRGLYFLVLCLVGFATWTVIFSNTNSASHSVTWWDENVHLRFGFQKLTYAVIIDAGSTGTRVLGFEFHQSLKDNGLKLKNGIFHEIKPGLSSYADEPLVGANSLKPLLEKAKHFIPQESWATTPIALKATAGLRLLPKEKADAILAAVSDAIHNSGFQTNADSVGIMDGVDEGIFSWFTVNFLLDRIGGPVSKTVAAMDLGGGSTQITVASSPETQNLYPKEDIQNISLFHNQVPLYTHSYLGLGLQSIRKAVLSYNKSDPESTVLESVCVNPSVTREWKYAGVTYTVKGAQTGKFEKVQYNGFNRREAVADWDACYNVIVKLIEEHGVVKSKDLSRQIVVFSYFFERATEAGIIDPLEGGKLTLQHYFDAGKQMCRTINSDLPLLCLDLTYMGALLHNGYGLPKSTPLLALKRIRGHEISWALGAAYHILQNGI